MLKVVYAHAMESGARGPTVRYLESLPGVHVIAPDQEMSLFNVRRRNCSLRCLPLGFLTSPTALGLCLLGLVLVAKGTHALLKLSGVLCLLGCLLRTLKCAVMVSMGRCTAVLMEAIQDVEPDVIVGSSWGGAVAVQCAARGATKHAALVLLGPALAAAGWKSLLFPDTSSTVLPTSLLSAGILVLHSKKDQLVPVAASRRFCTRNDVPLTEIPGGDHRLYGLIRTGRLEQLIRSMAAARKLPVSL